MLVEHEGRRPTVAASALVARSAVVSGDVDVAAGTVVLAGAVVTSQGGAPVRIGECCVVMENAVIRGAGKYPTTLGSYVLVGPNAHVSGATVESRVYLATGAAVFNGAVLEEGSVVAINAVVHIATRLTAGSFVPIGHIAFGDPARIVSPSEAPALRHEIAALGFTKNVFGLDAKSLADPSVIEELCRRYSRSLLGHRDDQVVDT